MKQYNFSDLKDIDIRQSVLEHGILIIKNSKSLEVEEYEDIVSQLGRVVHVKKHGLNDSRSIQIVSETEMFGNGDVEWHNDWSYGRGNYYGTMLYNKFNANKSTTDFVDMKLAYDEYPDKEELDLLEGSYFPPDIYDYCFTEQEKRILEKVKKTRKFAHTHHITGEKVLYFSPGSLQSDIDVTHLIEHCEKYIYRHTWEDNDILIWDNIRTMHRRHAFEGSRTLWRTQFWI